jgi:hypothetical protein
VWIYDPSTEKWSEGPELPEGRAGGKALQTGKTLVYTMGYSDAQTGQDPLDQQYPANLIFDGKSWKISSAAGTGGIEPLVIDTIMTHSGNSYIGTDADISLVKDGLFYTGLPMMNYGDMLSYSLASDSFKDSGTNYAKEVSDIGLRGITVDDTFYGFADDMMYRLRVNSGFIKVTAAASRHGKVKGTGSYVPGSTVSATVKADTNYRIKSLKLNGKAVKLKKNQTSYTLTMKDITSEQKITPVFKKYKFGVTVEKTGKGKVTGAGNYLLGRKAKVKIRASKGWYIKSVKVGKKTVRVKNRATVRSLKIKKDAVIKVVFRKK